MVALLPPESPGGRNDAVFWRRSALGLGTLCSILVAWISLHPSNRATIAVYFSASNDDAHAGYKNAGLVPMWAFDAAPKEWTVCTFKAPFESRTKVPRRAFDAVPLTRYSAYYNLADWLLRNPHKARGHGLEISGASFLQQFFAPGTTWDRRNYPEVDVMALHRSIPPNSYDWIILDQVLEHVALPFLAVAEIHRALKPGGRLMLAVPGFNPYHAGPQDYWRMSHDALRALLSVFEEVEMCGYYSSGDYIRRYVDKSKALGRPAYASLLGLPNKDPEAFRIAKGDPPVLTRTGELVVNSNQYIVHSWAIARK